MQACPVEIQAGIHWNLIGRSMTTSSPMLSPSSILLPTSPRHDFISARGNSAGCAILFELSLKFRVLEIA
jgi:hypothetical protein